MARFYDYNKYSVGNIRYPGRGPNSGMKLDPRGYEERDVKTKAKTNAILRRLKASQAGRFLSADYLGRDKHGR